MADDRPRPTENDNQDADESAALQTEPGEAPPSDVDAERGNGETEPDNADSDHDFDREHDVTPSPETTADRETTADQGTTADRETTTDDVDASGSEVSTPERNTGTSERHTEASEGNTEIAGTDAEVAGDRTDEPGTEPPGAATSVPEDVRKYERFKKMDGAQYERVNEFLRDRTYITAREWAIARLCADFRTETGVEMTKIGENLPELVPFMTDTYTPQAVNQARSAFEEKIRKAGATFLYGAMSGFFTAEELDDVMYEVTEVAKFLLEVEGVDLSVEEELEAEDRISGVMREVQSASEELRHDELECPNCGTELEATDDAASSGESDD